MIAVVSARVAASRLASAEAMAGAFCLMLAAVTPLAAVCNSPKVVFTCCISGARTPEEADAWAASRLVLTFTIAVFSGATPSCAGLIFTKASSDVVNVARSAHAGAGTAVVVGAAGVVDALVVVGALVGFGVEPVPQPGTTRSSATTPIETTNRRAVVGRIWRGLLKTPVLPRYTS